MAGNYSYGRIAIAICGRCSLKKKYSELSSDPNVSELRVCGDCKDELDPYRLPTRQPDSFVLRKPRPDLPLNDLPNYVLDNNGVYIDADTGLPILDIP